MCHNKIRPHSSTMPLYTMKKVLATQSLRQGSAPVSIPDARRKERFMQTGRTSRKSTGVKAALAGDAIDPSEDSVLDACIRLLEAKGHGI